MISVNEKRIEELKKKMKDTDVAAEEDAPPPPVEMEGVKEGDQEQPLELTKLKEEAAEKMECEEAASGKAGESLPPQKANEGGDDPLPPSAGAEDDLSKAPEVPLVIKGFTEAHKERVIRACVGFMKLGIEPDTLHALMRLCLRITKEWHHACLFASLGGVRTILTLNESSSFWGFQSFAALLMRHVLEEPNTLRHTMKKVRTSVVSFIHSFIAP